MSDTLDIAGKAAGDRPKAPSYGELVAVSAKIGVLSFGGPAAQIALMHREFVEERQWITEERFLHALNYCMLLPGPEAQQLATYCGWLLHRIGGGLAAGLLFILPGAVTMLALAFVYARFGSVPLVESLFYGIKAGVLAIVLQALFRVAKRALKTRLAWIVAATSFAALFLFNVPFPIVIVTAGLAGLWGSGSHAPQETIQEASKGAGVVKTLVAGLFVWALPVILAALLLSPDHVLIDVAGFFSTLAVVSFGGAYALLSYMAQVAVESYGWLQAGEMLDGLGLAETTPGPLILVTQFVGFLAGYRDPSPFSAITGGVLAAAMTTWVTFAPSFLWIFLGAPYIERLRGNARMAAALAGITAAVTGTILNLAVWFSLHVFFGRLSTDSAGWIKAPLPDFASIDLVAVLLAMLAAWLVFRARLGVATVVGISAVAGLIVTTLSDVA